MTGRFVSLPMLGTEELVGEAERWRRCGRGVQHELWLEPGGQRVLKVARPGLLHRLARLPLGRGLQDDLAGSIDDLLIPSERMRDIGWTDRRGRVRRAREGWLLPRLAPASFLAHSLWRQPDPPRAAEGMEQLVALLAELARRGLLMLDFVSDNFAWYQGSLRISDGDLVMPARRARWSPNCRPLWEGFRRGLGADYARLLEQRAIEAEREGNTACAGRLRASARDLAALLPQLLRRAAAAEGR